MYTIFAYIDSPNHPNCSAYIPYMEHLGMMIKDKRNSFATRSPLSAPRPLAVLADVGAAALLAERAFAATTSSTCGRPKLAQGARVSALVHVVTSR